MQLYKARNFSSFFQDTFTFLKTNGKHFFKHFLIVNGIFILILMALGYVFMKFYTELLFGSINGNDVNVIDQYMDENLPMIIIVGLLLFIIGLVAALVQYAYVPLYLKIYDEHQSSDFGTKEIIAAYKTNVGKLLVFLVAGILLAIPLIIVMGLGFFVLAITIIGLLAIPFLIGLFSVLYSSALIEYIDSKNSIWSCFGYAWSLISSKFWPVVGSVGLFWLISYVVQNVVTLVGYFFGIFKVVLGVEESRSVGTDPTETLTSMMFIMAITFVLSALVSILMNAIVMLNQGIVFYSLKEEKEHRTTKSEIDQIGLGE